MENWATLKLTSQADRELVALALYRSGYTIRQRKEKEKTSTKAGTKTVIVLDYRKEEP